MSVTPDKGGMQAGVTALPQSALKSWALSESMSRQLFYFFFPQECHCCLCAGLYCWKLSPNDSQVLGSWTDWKTKSVLLLMLVTTWHTQYICGCCRQLEQLECLFMTLAFLAKEMTSDSSLGNKTPLRAEGIHWNSQTPLAVCWITGQVGAR